MLWFWGQKVKGQGHSNTAWVQSVFSLASFVSVTVEFVNMISLKPFKISLRNFLEIMLG